MKALHRNCTTEGRLLRSCSATEDPFGCAKTTLEELLLLLGVMKSKNEAQAREVAQAWVRRVHTRGRSLDDEKLLELLMEITRHVDTPAAVLDFSDLGILPPGCCVEWRGPKSSQGGAASSTTRDPVINGVRLGPRRASGANNVLLFESGADTLVIRLLVFIWFLQTVCFLPFCSSPPTTQNFRAKNESIKTLAVVR